VSALDRLPAHRSQFGGIVMVTALAKNLLRPFGI